MARTKKHQDAIDEVLAGWDRDDSPASVFHVASMGTGLPFWQLLKAR